MNGRSRVGTAAARVSEIENAVHDPSVGTAERLLSGLGYQLAVLPTSHPTASHVGYEILRSGTSTSEQEDRAFRALLTLSDGLIASEPDVRVALCVTPPALSGDRRFDAAIAAIVEHHLQRDGLPVPAWTRNPNRTVTGTRWIPDIYAGPEVESEAPPAFRRRGVFLAERELAST